MRTIKVRAWDKVYEHFHEGDIISEYVLGDFLDNPEYAVTQYSNVVDKNGIEIFEGDIVNIYGEQEFDYGYNFNWNHNAIVKWDDEECCFYLDVIKKYEARMDEDLVFSVDRFPLRKWNEGEWWIEYKVIGNIFEGESK